MMDNRSLTRREAIRYAIANLGRRGTLLVWEDHRRRFYVRGPSEDAPFNAQWRVEFRPRINSCDASTRDDPCEHKNLFMDEGLARCSTCMGSWISMEAAERGRAALRGALSLVGG